MTYKLTLARLVAETHGPYVPPEQRASIHVLAENFPFSRSFHDMVVPDVQENWTSKDYTTGKDALLEAAGILSDRLSSVTGESYSIATEALYYKVIHDTNGNVIGHMTIGWALKSKAPIVLPFPVQDQGIQACVIIYVTPTAPIKPIAGAR